MKPARSYRYWVVDVLTKQPLEGNSLAVFPDASGLDDDMMQRIARELIGREERCTQPTKPHESQARCMY